MNRDFTRPGWGVVDADSIAALATLLTPLGAMGGAIFFFLTRRIHKLEKENARLVGYVLTTCVERTEGLEKLADLIVTSRSEEGR